MAAAAFRLPLSLPFSRRLPFSSKSPFPRTPIAASLSSSSGDSHNSNKHQLVLYTKKGCCLCEGLKDKLDVAFSFAGTHSLDGVQLLTRDIEANPEWERMYQYEIPVLARVLPDGTEKVLPRLSPRLGVELIQKKIATAFED